MIGDINLSEEEKQVLKLHPKFSVLEDLKPGGLDAVQEATMAKLRMEKVNNKYANSHSMKTKMDELYLRMRQHQKASVRELAKNTVNKEAFKSLVSAVEKIADKTNADVGGVLEKAQEWDIDAENIIAAAETSVTLHRVRIDWISSIWIQ